mmetsp:Transcript_31494/g.96329  ORF Transcript_31494/g.96329 Transcript_31494/m.96329 type:complete len:203 (+) Transcript_31494:844-1452(+)
MGLRPEALGSPRIAPASATVFPKAPTYPIASRRRNRSTRTSSAWRSSASPAPFWLVNIKSASAVWPRKRLPNLVSRWALHCRCASTACHTSASSSEEPRSASSLSLPPLSGRAPTSGAPSSHRAEPRSDAPSATALGVASMAAMSTAASRAPSKQPTRSIRPIDGSSGSVASRRPSQLRGVPVAACAACLVTPSSWPGASAP